MEDIDNAKENVNQLCKSIETIGDGESILLGVDENNQITIYIKENYGDLTLRRKNYEILANIFKSAIDQKFESQCEIQNLYGNGTTGLFEFDYSIPGKFILWIKSEISDDNETIKVYFHVNSSEEKETLHDY